MNIIHNKVRSLMLIAILVIALASCKKSFLEIKPKGRVIATKTTDYDLLLNNLDLMNINSDGHILMGDEVAVTEPQWTSATFREKQLFKWNPDIYTVAEDAKESAVPVKGLYIYNKIIDEVMESTEGSELTKKSLQAEALAGRAWTNFLLVNFYGKPYNAATSSTDPGFPLITKADINQENHVRATVQQVYDLIVSDLTTAIPNFVHTGVPHRMRMSKAAAQGLLAKVYIFMGKYADALPLLNESISNLTQSTASTVLLNYNTAFPGFPTAVNDLENVYGKIIFNTYTGTGNRLVWITPETRALYGATDVRLAKWIVASTVYPNGLTLYRRSGSFSAYIGVRVPELYLLRAEVKARGNDLPGAVADLEFLRQNRMPAADAPVPPAVASDKMLLLQFIMEERIREFAVQGYRWFDMRRLSVDPLFTTPSYKHHVYDVTGEIKETFTLTPERFVFRIPPKILAENPTMQDNP